MDSRVFGAIRVSLIKPGSSQAEFPPKAHPAFPSRLNPPIYMFKTKNHGSTIHQGRLQALP